MRPQQGRQPRHPHPLLRRRRVTCRRRRSCCKQSGVRRGKQTWEEKEKGRAGVGRNRVSFLACGPLTGTPLCPPHLHQCTATPSASSHTKRVCGRPLRPCFWKRPPSRSRSRCEAACSRAQAAERCAARDAAACARPSAVAAAAIAAAAAAASGESPSPPLPPPFDVEEEPEVLLVGTSACLSDSSTQPPRDWRSDAVSDSAAGVAAAAEEAAKSLPRSSSSRRASASSCSSAAAARSSASARVGDAGLICGGRRRGVMGVRRRPGPPILGE